MHFKLKKACKVFYDIADLKLSGIEVIKHLCSTQLGMKFILRTNVKMTTIVGILTFIRRINATLESFKAKAFSILVYEQL